MRMLPEVEMQIRRAIRDERAKDPLITIGKIQEHLSKKFDRPFAYDYIMRMVHKVAKETMVEADRTKLEARLSQTREQFRIMRDRLMEIIYWEPDQKLADMGIRQKPPYDEDVIAAVKTVATMEARAHAGRSPGRHIPQPAFIDQCAHTRARPRTAHPWSTPSPAPPEARNR